MTFNPFKTTGAYHENDSSQHHPRRRSCPLFGGWYDDQLAQISYIAGNGTTEYGDYSAALVYSEVTHVWVSEDHNGTTSTKVFLKTLGENGSTYRYFYEYKATEADSAQKFNIFMATLLHIQSTGQHFRLIYGGSNYRIKGFQIEPVAIP